MMKKGCLILFLLFGLTPPLWAQDTTPPENTMPYGKTDYGKIVASLKYEFKQRKADKIMWVLDASPSMLDDIQEIGAQLDHTLKGKQDWVMGMVTYADKPKLLLKPTKDLAKIKLKFAQMQLEKGGKENLYGAIETTLKYLKRAKAPILIVATDEIGDDTDKLEKLIKKLKKQDVTVLVLSPEASFGHKDWKWSKINWGEKTSDTQRFNSQNGPASCTQEGLFDFTFVQRATWTRTVNQMEQRVWAIPAGWAPYGLAMMARETKGKVFTLSPTTCQLPTPFENKEKYLPDYNLPSAVKKNIKKDPWRKSLDEAAKVWSTYQLINREYPGAPVTKATLITGIAMEMKKVEDNLKVTMQTLDTLKKGLKVEREYTPHQHLRYRANLELAYACALTSRFHLHQFRKDYERFKKPDFMPDPHADKAQWNIKIVPDGAVLVDDVYAEWKKEFPEKHKKALARRMGYKKDKPSEEAPKNDKDAKPNDADDNDDEEEYDESAFGDELALSEGKPETRPLIPMLDLADHSQAKNITEMRVMAEKALKVVVANHPQTPWATLASKMAAELGYYDVYFNAIGPSTSGDSNQ